MKRNKILLFFCSGIISVSCLLIISTAFGVKRGGNLDMDEHQIINLGGPGSPNYDAANKIYVDSAVSGSSTFIPKYGADNKLTESIITDTGTQIGVSGNLDMNQNQIIEMRIQNIASQAEEDALNPAVGQIWIRTDL